MTPSSARFRPTELGNDLLAEDGADLPVQVGDDLLAVREERRDLRVNAAEILTERGTLEAR